MRSDGQESALQALQLELGLLVALATAIHFPQMVRCLQCLADAGKIGTGDSLEKWECRQTMWMGGILASLMEFALQVLLRDLDIP